MDNLQEFKNLLMQPITVFNDTRVVNGFCMGKKDTILELYTSTGDNLIGNNGMGKGSLEAINQFLSMHGLNPVAPLHRSVRTGEDYIHYGLGLALERRLWDALQEFEKTQGHENGFYHDPNRGTYGLTGMQGTNFFAEYHKTERYAARQTALGKFLDENIDLFAQIALGKNARDFKSEATKEATAEQENGPLTSIDEISNAVEKSQIPAIPTEQDRYFIELLPENLRSGLKDEFVKAVLNEDDVQTKFRQILVEKVLEKLGLDQPR